MNRDSWGHSYLTVGGDILGFVEDRILRKRLPRIQIVFVTQHCRSHVLNKNQALKAQERDTDNYTRTLSRPLSKHPFLKQARWRVLRSTWIK